MELRNKSFKIKGLSPFATKLKHLNASTQYLLTFYKSIFSLLK